MGFNLNKIVGSVDVNVTGGITASNTTITDTGGYFTGTDVESALQQIGANPGLAAGGTATGNIRLNNNVNLYFGDSGTSKFLRYDTGEGKLWLATSADNEILKLTYGGASGYLQIDQFGLGEVMKLSNGVATWTRGPVFNEQGEDYDTRMESENDDNIFRIDASADAIGVGEDGPLAKLHIDQSSATGAKPVLLLDQGDLSEEFIRLVGESTTNNTQSLVDAADLTTPGSIVGWFKIYVQDNAGSGAITDGVYYVPFYSTPT